MHIRPSVVPQEKLIDFFKWFGSGPNEGLPHQKEAIQLLQQSMPDSLLQPSAAWIKAWRTAPIAPSTPESTLPPQGVSIICEFEGFRANVYNDGVGVPTIGYGSTFYSDGRRVAWGDPPISEPKARQMMEAIAEKDFWDVISKTIPYWQEMNDNQRSALLSFAYNLGAHFYGSSGFNTISGCLKDKRWQDVPSALDLYCNPGSAVEAGLKRRRKAEGELWRMK